MPSTVPSSRTLPDMLATEVSVPAVSKKSTNRKVSTTMIRPTSNTEAMSSARKVGSRLGGSQSPPPHVASPVIRPISVMPMMPITMAPGTLRASSTIITMKPRQARATVEPVGSPTVTRVTGWSTTIPAFFRPMSARKNPIPAPTPRRRLFGTASMTHWRNLVALRTMNRMPEQNTAPRATCQAWPIPRTTS